MERFDEERVVSVSDEYLEHLRDLMPGVPRLRARRMFGGAGLYDDDLFFAIVIDDTLHLKADDANRPLFREGGGEPFVFTDKRGRSTTMNFWSVPADVLEESEQLERWVREALACALRARKKKR